VFVETFPGQHPKTQIWMQGKDGTIRIAVLETGKDSTNLVGSIVFPRE
jgi:hypothetical protein